MEIRRSYILVAQAVLFLAILMTATSSSSTCLTGPARNISITFLRNAETKGAVCLDGSPAAYYHDLGYGEGKDSWIIFIMGGGWCNSTDDCMLRSTFFLGSTRGIKSTEQFGHILDSSKANPDFCNWNRVLVPYCDGSSFTGNVEAVNSTTKLHYRGARIYKELMEELLAKGMQNATNALLSGSSAGGLTTIIYCDRFRSLFPSTTRVKCLADSALFLHEESLLGNRKFDRTFDALVELQGSAEALPPSCIAEQIKPSLCFFPEYILPTLQTPIFLVMSLFDQAQIRYNLSPAYDACLKGNNCTSSEMNTIEGLRLQLLHSLPIGSPSLRGMFVTNCLTHEVTIFSWIAPKIMKIQGNKTYRQVFGDWYYNREATQVINSSSDVRNCSEFHIYIRDLNS